MSYLPPASDEIDVSWQGTDEYSAPASTSVFIDWTDEPSVAGYVLSPSMLGDFAGSGYQLIGIASDSGVMQAPAAGALHTPPIFAYASDSTVLGSPASFAAYYTPIIGYSENSEVLGYPSAYGRRFDPVIGYLKAGTPLGNNPRAYGSSLTVGFVSASSMLGAAALSAFHDFTATIPSRYVDYYVMRINGVQIPISSWQATLRRTNSNYAQCVVPGAFEYIDFIVDAAEQESEFVIYKGILFLKNNLRIEQEIVRSPIQDFAFDRGPGNATCTLRGYFRSFVPGEDNTQAQNRTLQKVRSISATSSRTRVRCDIDWFLRPGRKAFFENTEIDVGFINYYVTSSGDGYMDVGDAAE
jgi:hypothetical protein